MTFMDYLRERLPLVEGALARAAARPMTDGTVSVDLERYLYAPLARFTSGGGKRVRPVLALLGAEAVGGRPEDALSAGIAIELFQSAALVHDDIADESELRRGEPCLYKTEGVGPATNMGDLALTQVFEVVLADEGLDPARRLAVLAELVRMERHTLEGQALDLGWARDGRWDVTCDDYVYMVTSKTAWYSAALPLYIGAIAGGAGKDDAEGLVDLGLHAGVAFQIQDDLLNLVGNRCIEGGVNHMGRFCEELNALYGIEYQDLWSLEDAERYLRDGWMLLAGMSGPVYEGGKEYGGHVLLIWRCDSSGVYIRDPDDITLTGPIAWEQFERIEWGPYFYAIREGQQ